MNITVLVNIKATPAQVWSVFKDLTAWERWYGVHVNITSPELLKENLTGEFDTETIQEVMNVLSLTHRFFYFIDGKEITIAYRK